MKNKIITLNKLSKIKLKKPIGVCWGGFDLLHSGHINHFLFAKKYCSTLIVGINNDNEFPNKGKNRPILNQANRAKFLSSISVVDYVLIYTGKYPKKSQSMGIIHGKKVHTPFIPIELFKKILPDFYFKGYEYKGKKIPEVAILKNYNTKIKFGPKDYIFSSTAIIGNKKNENKK
ncbi:adenylyltransferase/cytidyltransferase family protein [Alphaproteobacteria bacterium]|jgi:cytidyltransferase-like protein|nr:adenylyltransferase/cytidyltransferase family protein [Alphaproteobacteria bacterium]